MHASTAMLINLHLKTGDKVSNEEISASEDLLELVEDAEAYLASYTGGFEFLVDTKAHVDRGMSLTIGQARGVLNCMVADQRRKADAATPAVTLPEGAVFRIDGAFFKTKKNAAGTRIYGLKLNTRPCEVAGCSNLAAGKMPGEHIAVCKVHADGAALDKIKLDWSYGSAYAEMLKKFIVEGGKPLTLAEMEAWGVMSGVCLICGATLSNPASVARGIGPVCATRYSY